MSTAKRSDHELMLILQDKNSSPEERNVAAEELLGRYEEQLLKFVRNIVFGNSIDEADIVQDTFMRAIKSYDSKKGKVKDLFFKSFLRTIARNLVKDSGRKNKTANIYLQETKRSEGDLTRMPQNEMILSEIRREIQKSLQAIPNDEHRRILIWFAFLGISQSKIGELFPEKEAANIRKICQRSKESYIENWIAGPGPKLCEAFNVQLKSFCMPDPDRITNPQNRKVYNAWVDAAGAGIPAVAKNLGMPEKKVRDGVLDSLEELMQVSIYRGSRSWQSLDFSKLSDKSGLLSDYLEAGRDREGEYMGLSEEEKRICDVINRQFLIMRISLGLAPVSDATHTIGSLVHEHVMKDGPEAHAEWASALNLSMPRFRRLLGDDLEPSDDLIDRLSMKLGVDREALRRLDSNRSDTRVKLRAPNDDVELLARIRKNILARIGK